MKLLFDECYTSDGAAVIKSLLELYDPPIVSEFLPHYLSRHHGEKFAASKGKGVHDEDWAPLIRADTSDRWIVVSLDLGHSASVRMKGTPLHVILPRLKITGVWLPVTLNEANRYEKIRSVLIVMNEIISVCPRAEPGSRFKIKRLGTGYELTAWDRGRKEIEQWG